MHVGAVEKSEIFFALREQSELALKTNKQKTEKFSRM